MAQNDFPGMISDTWEGYMLQRLNSVPYRLSAIQSTPPPGHPVLTLGFEPILVVTILGVAESSKGVIDDMTYGIDFELTNLLHVENVNPTYENLNTSMDELENQ